jgi:hypothetical protein
MIPKVGSPPPLGSLWDYLGGAGVGPSKRFVCLFTIGVTSDQTLGNWSHFIKPIHRIKNLLTVKQLLNKLTNSVAISPHANYTDRATAALSAKLVPTFADRGCHVVSATDPPGPLISVF